METPDSSINRLPTKSNPGNHRSELRRPSDVPQEYMKPINMPPGLAQTDVIQDTSHSNQPTKDASSPLINSQLPQAIRSPSNVPSELLNPLAPLETEAKDCNSHLDPIENNIQSPPQNCPETPPSMKSPASNKSNLSPFAPEFIPRNFQDYRNVNPEAVGGGEVGEGADSYPQQALRRFLLEVNLNPAKFQYRVESLANTLDTLTTPDNFPSIISIIFDEAVQQPNFRYHGAKLCSFLSHTLQEKEAFRNMLFQRCEREFSRHKEYIATNNGEYLRGFGLFLAELYAILKFSEKRSDLLRDFLLTLCSTLLESPEDENMKCVCKILKMVSMYLIDHENEEGSVQESLKNLARKLEELSSTSTDSVRSLVQAIMALREANWGKSLSSASDPSPDVVMPLSNSASYPFLDEPVYYGPDGQPFTQEERLFLQNNLALEDCDDGDNFYDDDPLDDEMSAAYEEFLRETAKQQ